MSMRQVNDLSKLYAEAVYGKTPAQVEAEKRKKDDLAGAPLTVTNADKKANTPAYQNYKAGKKGYKAADHLKNEEVVNERDYHIGQGEKIQKRTKKWMDKKGQSGAPGLNAMKARTAEHEARRGVKVKEEEDLSDWRKDLEEASLVEVENSDAEDEEFGAKRKIDVKKGIKNEVKINPNLPEAMAEIGGEVISEKESYKTVAAVIDYDRSKKGTDDAVYDTEHGEKKKAKKERDYAAWERKKMKKDDPDWEHKKGSTSEGYQVQKPANKEIKDLKKGVETLKGKNIAKADKVEEAKDWIDGAVKRPGAFTRKANAADMSVQQFAGHVDANPDKYSTRTKKQANLAQTFASMKKEDIEEMFYNFIIEGEGHGVSLRGLHLDKARRKNTAIGSDEDKRLTKKINDKETQMQQVQSHRWNPKTKKLEKNLGSRPHVSPEKQRNESAEHRRNPEKYAEKPDSEMSYAEKKRKRMNDPKTGINSPAFKKFMADRGM